MCRIDSSVVIAVLFLTAPCLAQQEPASIEGTVLNALTGEGLKKAQVSAHNSRTNEEAVSTLTDASGHFVLTGLSPGSYIVNAFHNGFIGKMYGARSAGRPAPQLKLAGGEKLTGIDIRLDPQGVITGKVVDEDGDPLSNMMVQLVRQVYRLGRKDFGAAQTSSTNDRGEYRIFGIPPGKYLVSVFSGAGRRTPGSDSTYATVYYPSALTPEAATPLDVTPGVEMRAIDITLLKTRAFRIRGRVVDAGGGAVEGASVWLMAQHTAMSASRRAGAYQGMGAGEFEFRDVVPGSYLLGAETSGSGDRLSSRMAVEVGNSNADGLVLTLRPVSYIKGKISIEGKTESKLAVLNVYVSSKEPGVSAQGRSQTEADGSFQLQVWPEAYDVHVFGLTGNMYLKSVKFGDANVTDSGLDFSQGVLPGELAVLVSPSGGQVEGSVLDEKDQPFSGAQVVLIPDTARRGKADLYKTAFTDASGHFSIHGIAPGEYKLLAWDEIEPGAWLDPDFVKPFESQAETVTIQENSQESKQLKVITSPSGR